MQELIFILADSAREENVGAAARAIKTMNISALYLVNPQCDYLGNKARATAHGSNDILEEALVFSDLEEALKNVDFVLGSTAKNRSLAPDYIPVHDISSFLKAKDQAIHRVGVLFGGEESGLSNEQLDKCHALSTIPMVRKYPSLNLAQAVMVYASHLSALTFDWETKPHTLADAPELAIVREKALQVLDDVELKPDNLIHSRIVSSLMLMDKDQINLFHSFCKYYLKKYHGRIK